MQTTLSSNVKKYEDRLLDVKNVVYFDLVYFTNLVSYFKGVSCSNDVSTNNKSSHDLLSRLLHVHVLRMVVIKFRHFHLYKFTCQLFCRLDNVRWFVNTVRVVSIFMHESC